MDYAQIAIALVMGISLSAACGFRIFVPLLAVGLAVRLCGIEAAPALAWTATDLGLVCLAVATLVEILAYYIPWVDNLLDTVHGPLAMVAGTLLVGGLLGDMPPALQWGLGVVAGGGAAGMVKAGTATARAASTATTGGLGNCVVATVENICATVGSVLAVLAPVLAIFFVILVVGGMCAFIYRLRRRKAAETAS
ncbi:MAG: DUF4126 domain-containing protein [Akkermansia sp.]|nr:DUF4126 domain-containing protein [Akkermansia sp.]